MGIIWDLVVTLREGRTGLGEGNTILRASFCCVTGLGGIIEQGYLVLEKNG